MRKVFIVSHEKFPRGSAGANYIQYFAYALQQLKFSVVVIGKNSTCQTEFNKLYKGITYAIYASNHGKRWKSAFDINECKKIFDYYGASENDIFIFYNLDISGMVYCHRKYGNNNLYSIRVEDMQPYQYKFGKFTPRYLEYKSAVKFAWNNFAGSFSISKCLQRQDIEHKCASMCLPIMADPFEYECNLDKKKENTISFIYPGMKATGYEDDLETMFISIASLGDDDISKIKIHITGANIEKVKDALNQDIFKRLENVIIAHGFISYDELVKLYQQSDFLLLIRKVNEITRANFPSKVPELLSYGVIPICTDVGDYTKDYLNSECAFIVPGNDRTACIRAIKQAIDISQEEYTKMRYAARKLAEEKFYYKVWTKEILNFLEDK